MSHRCRHLWGLLLSVSALLLSSTLLGGCWQKNPTVNTPQPLHYAPSLAMVLSPERPNGQLVTQTYEVDAQASPSKETSTGMTVYRPVITLRALGSKPLVTLGPLQDTTSLMLYVSLVELDPTNQQPELVAQSFTGGAHCCVETVFGVATTPQGPWEVVSLGQFNGGPTPLDDLDDDGVAEVITQDDAFLYTFDAYAASLAPPKIWGLNQGKVVDRTREPAFRAYLKKGLAELGAPPANQVVDGKVKKSDPWPNGYWAGFVAWKSLVGEGPEAWATMERAYDRTRKYCPDLTRGESDCPTPLVGFPDVLAPFLKKHGYKIAE
jgi:hypothetical protein